jgi:hypothetical protein
VAVDEQGHRSQLQHIVRRGPGRFFLTACVPFSLAELVYQGSTLEVMFYDLGPFPFRIDGLFMILGELRLKVAATNCYVADNLR